MRALISLGFVTLVLNQGALAASMNGIDYSEYKDFPSKWELVTIRFRKDTGEMRLTYGNPLAMQTLKEGKTNYPDGAVFAKTGIHTGSDPQFESSLVPRGIRRYQFMVKNKKKYSSTNGWGYALFDAQGATFPEDVKTTVNACYACHTIVENKGDVFSEPFDFIKDTKFPAQHKNPTIAGITFEWKEIKGLPQKISEHLPKVTRVRVLTNPNLKAAVFQGTLDELKPVLQEESKKHQVPALFMSQNNQKFVIVVPKKSSSECMELGSVEIISTDLNLRPIKEKFCTHD